MLKRRLKVLWFDLTHHFPYYAHPTRNFFYRWAPMEDRLIRHGDNLDWGDFVPDLTTHALKEKGFRGTFWERVKP
jgi:hypothetical protein